MTGLLMEAQHGYGHFELDVAFNLKFRRLALFGPSGAGKTTLLNILAGLLNPRKGRVELEGTTFMDTSRGVNWSPRRRKVGYLMQGAPLFPHLSVKDNLQYSGRLTIQNPRGRDIIEMLEIDTLLDRRPDRLSGGERRRVGLAQAMFSDPRLLLLDEPLTGLNESLRKRILPDFRTLLHEWGRPSIVVSHRPEVVSALCDTVVPLQDGCGGDSLSPTDLFQSEFYRSRQLIGATNYYRVRASGADHGEGVIQVKTERGLTFRIPGSCESVNDRGQMILEFSADEPVLGRRVSGELSPRNHWEAGIRKIEEKETALLLTLQIGDEQMWVRVTRKTGREFNLREADAIDVFLKTQSIHVHPA